MNLASFLANKCLEFLLHCDGARDNGQPAFAAPNAGQPSSAPPRRPPWSLSRPEFLERCDGCRACLERCPQSILFADDDGLPAVDFSRGACDFCGACAEVCSRGAFQAVSAAPPWTIKARPTGACLTRTNVLCRTCAEHCPAGAIIFPRQVGRVSTPRILPERCTGCGACCRPCPAGAIAMEEDIQPGERK